MAKVITLLLPVFSLVYLWQSYLLPSGNVLIGARTFPLLVGGIMLVVSLILVWQQFRPLPLPAKKRSCTRRSTSIGDQDAVQDWPAILVVVSAVSRFHRCVRTAWLRHRDIAVPVRTVHILQPETVADQSGRRRQLCRGGLRALHPGSQHPVAEWPARGILLGDGLGKLHRNSERLRGRATALLSSDGFCRHGARDGDRRAPRHGRVTGDFAAASLHLQTGRSDRRLHSVRRHLLRRAIRRLDDQHPHQHAGREFFGRHRHRRLPDGE